tara:strand:+ start:2832 stop:3821 length:990 start_codon:yes stop_codon:yes gene_type:complete
MKYLILGSGSFAGQLIFAEYLKRNYDVYGFNRSRAKDHHQWPWIKKYKNDLETRWFEYNLTSNVDEMISHIKRLKPNIIIDFMGQGMVAPSWEKPEVWYSTNIAIKARLMNALIDASFLHKYIRIGTPEVFGSNKNFIKEDECFNPSTPYAVSHAAIDFNLRCLYKQYDFPYLIGRFANFYGVGQQLYRIIPRLFLSCRSEKNFTLDGKGDSRRSFIFSNDIISAIDSMVKFNGIGQEFNFSSNEEISIISLVNKICNLTNVDKFRILKFGPERPGKDRYYRLDITKSKKVLNWEPEFFLDEGLQIINEWISENIENLSNKSWTYEHKD